MNFIYPAFLFGLFAIAIPIIIHFFSFRSFKKIYFTNVRFLKEIKQETQTRSRLKHLMVLLARIFFVIFLVIAFSQPYIPSGIKTPADGHQTISIFIDNSFSMDAVNENGRLWEQAKQIAHEIAIAFQPGDQFQILTNDFEGRHQRLINREELEDLIDETDISPSSRNISEIFSRQKEAVMNEKSSSAKKTFFIISDFQNSICDFNSLKNDTTIQVKLVPLQPNVRNNLYVDSCWFDSPVRRLNQPDEIHIRIVNKSENYFENIPVKLTINGQIRAIGTSFSALPKSLVDTVLNFTSTSAGWQNAVVEITDYPITFDDKFFVSYHIAKSIRVLCINAKDTNMYIQSLFGKDPFFTLQNSSLRNIDYSSFISNNFIILSGLDSLSSGLAQELKKFTENGGSLLVFPPGKINFESYKEFFLTMNMNFYESLDSASTKISRVNLEHNLYEKVFDTPDQKKSPDNMDLPVVYKHFSFSKLTKTNEEWLMKMQNGSTFLSHYSWAKGTVYVSASPLDPGFSSFTQHAIFVPTLYQIALHSIGTRKLYYSIGVDNYVESGDAAAQSSGGENIFHIVSEDKTVDFIPEFKMADSHVNLFVHQQIQKAGNYLITRSGTEPERISFNYNRKESDISLFPMPELEALLKNPDFKNFSMVDADAKIIGKKLEEISNGIKLWKYCIIFALIFLTAEIALLRWWK